MPLSIHRETTCRLETIKSEHNDKYDPLDNKPDSANATTAFLLSLKG